MPLNCSRGQMYPWCTHTKNYIRGDQSNDKTICKHECIYCYAPDTRAARFYTGEPQLIKKELTENMGSGKTIFVGSMTDMFGTWIPGEWIERVLEHCRKYPHNTYLFQSKNPIRFLEFLNLFPMHTIFGTTIETNRPSDNCAKIMGGAFKAPQPSMRARAMHNLDKKYDKMISIEPIMDFDLDIMVKWMHAINPKFVSIGADSKGHKLPEPPGVKVRKLISALEMHGIEVKLKSNLRRLGVW